MILDEITAALRTGQDTAALTAGVAHASELAPVVYAIADKFCQGIYLLPDDNELLFNGLHILAAARHSGLCDHLLDIAQQPASQLDTLFPDHATESLVRLLLSVWDRSPDDLFDLIEHADMAPQVKCALYEVLARLTFDGRIAREETACFLARIERDDLIEDGDMEWWGWEQAVVKLGLVELEGALRRVWSKLIYELHEEADHNAMLDRLKLAAADLSDPRLFDEEEMRAIDDPVEGVAWVERRAAMMAEWAAERGDDKEIDDDAAKAVRLTDDERQWLAGFLSCSQVPDGTMSLEMLDGFFTALVIGPDLVMPSDYLSWIWGDDDEEPNWDSPEQAEHVFGLLAKHWNAIAERRLADGEHRPIIDTFGIAMPGEEWADGFVAGMGMAEDAWDQMIDNRQTGEIILPIMALCSDLPEAVQEKLTDETRAAIVDHLPEMVQMIAAYWRGQDQGLPRGEPIRSAKVGRNEPCPCGSGKKFKKCCGAATPPTVH